VGYKLANILKLKNFIFVGAKPKFFKTQFVRYFKETKKSVCDVF